MTKKILSSSGRGKSEFLLPVNTGRGISLVGMKTGKTHDAGMVVYTGVELSAEKLMVKASASGLPEDRRLFESYLAQILSFKISRKVRVVPQKRDLVLESFQS